MRIALRAALAASLLVAPGCRWFRRAPKTPPPPPSPTIVTPTPKPEPPVLEPPATPPATTPQQVPAGKPPLPETTRPVPAPPPPAKPAARPSRRPAAQPAETKKPEPAQTPPPVAVPAETPRLGEVLDPAQRQTVQRSYDENHELARHALDAIAKYPLSRDQRASVSRARSFLQQAEELVKTDLPTAARLARRANLLARDLLDSLR